MAKKDEPRGDGFVGWRAMHHQQGSAFENGDDSEEFLQATSIGSEENVVLCDEDVDSVLVRTIMRTDVVWIEVFERECSHRHDDLGGDGSVVGKQVVRGLYEVGMWHR